MPCVFQQAACADWVVFPIVNFSAFLGAETFAKTTKYKLPKELVLFDKDCNGLVRARIKDESQLK